MFIGADMARLGNRGRPRLNRPAIDLGTPELRARRMMAIGPKRVGWPEPDPTDGERLLGLLLWRGYLAPDYEQSKRMYDAGIQFAGWWRVVHPKTTPTGTLGALQPGRGEEPDVQEARDNLTAASAYLLAKSRKCYDVLVNAVIYDGMNAKNIEHLRTALCRLMEWRKS